VQDLNPEDEMRFEVNFDMIEKVNEIWHNGYSKC
jgi:hypothetical protein